MRRLFGVVLAGAILILPAFSQSAFAQQAAAAPQKFTLEGDVALWSVAIKADKTADYEQVLAKLKEALAKSEKPEAKQQLAGWRVMQGVKNPQTGDIIYTHIITPVPGADYTIMTNIYDAFPDPMVRQQVYDLYRGAFSQNLGVNSGKIVADFSK
jgi:hypothetical protein